MSTAMGRMYACSMQLMNHIPVLIARKFVKVKALCLRVKGMLVFDFTPWRSSDCIRQGLQGFLHLDQTHWYTSLGVDLHYKVIF